MTPSGEGTTDSAANGITFTSCPNEPALVTACSTRDCRKSPYMRRGRKSEPLTEGSSDCAYSRNPPGLLTNMHIDAARTLSRCSDDGVPYATPRPAPGPPVYQSR